MAMVAIRAMATHPMVLRQLHRQHLLHQRQVSNS